VPVWPSKEQTVKIAREIWSNLIGCAVETIGPIDYRRRSLDVEKKRERDDASLT
jgi:hypothetical protein